MKEGHYFYDGTKSDKTGLRSGSMYDGDGNLVATYQQISHDDPIQAMLWGAQPTLGIWQGPVETIQPAPIPGGGALGTTAKVGTKGAKGFVIGSKVVKSGGIVGKAIEKVGLTATKGAGRGVLEVAGNADDALMLFNELRGGNKVVMKRPGVWVAESASGTGSVTFRRGSSIKSGTNAAVNVDGLEAGIKKIHFTGR